MARATNRSFPVGAPILGPEYQLPVDQLQTGPDADRRGCPRFIPDYGDSPGERCRTSVPLPPFAGQAYHSFEGEKGGRVCRTRLSNHAPT